MLIAIYLIYYPLFGVKNTVNQLWSLKIHWYCRTKYKINNSGDRYHFHIVVTTSYSHFKTAALTIPCKTTTLFTTEYVISLEDSMIIVGRYNSHIKVHLCYVCYTHNQK